MIIVMCPKDADGLANNVDPDQTAPLGAVLSGSTLFAQICLSENLEPLRSAVLFSNLQSLLDTRWRVCVPDCGPRLPKETEELYELG